MLLAQLRGKVDEAFWLSHLGLRVSPRMIAATPYCRSIPLTPAQSRHLHLLKLGMLEAERSLTPGVLASPWNALSSARDRLRAGMPRKCFEAGFVMRLFLLLQEACRPEAAGEWTVLHERGQRRFVLRS